MLDELRMLERRANDLLKLGSAAERGLADEDRAMAEYKALKSGIAARLKEVERRPPAAVHDWAVSTFTSALRAAYIGMRSPTNTTPRNSRWRTSVHELVNELSYYAARMAKGPGQQHLS